MPPFYSRFCSVSTFLPPDLYSSNNLTMFSLRRLVTSTARVGLRYNATAAAAAPEVPPLLLTLRTDLKNAMRAKDQTSLAVLRGLLAEIKNAQFTDKPANTDLDILNIINKTKAKSQVSIDEAAKAGRPDLVEKETAQFKLLEQYAGAVDTVGQEEIMKVAEGLMEAANAEGKKVNMGELMREVMNKFEGRPVVRADVAVVAKKVLGGK